MPAVAGCEVLSFISDVFDLNSETSDGQNWGGKAFLTCQHSIRHFGAKFWRKVRQHRFIRKLG